ncbi:hypothetical protein C1646_777793 [Rhizophagus diaphanus]|nr:hypothetical protein C1646_777793 [Rhizophagus diaphanus] [Rhizophagus sp. MUCL 43196]
MMKNIDNLLVIKLTILNYTTENNTFYVLYGKIYVDHLLISRDTEIERKTQLIARKLISISLTI